MENIAKNSNKNTITSLELIEQINIFRKEDDRNPLAHNDLLKVIRDEFEDEIGMGIISHTPYIHPQNGQTYPMFELTLSQAKQVLVRESKTVRKAVIAYIEKLESRLNTPQTYLDALKALVAAEEHKLQLQAQLQEAKPKVEIYDRIVDRNALTSLRDTAKELKMSEKAMINMLLYNRFLYRDMAGQLKPIAKYIEDGSFELKSWIRKVKDTNGVISEKAGNQTMVTIKGKTKIMELINKLK